MPSVAGENRYCLLVSWVSSTSMTGIRRWKPSPPKAEGAARCDSTQWRNLEMFLKLAAVIAKQTLSLRAAGADKLLRIYDSVIQCTTSENGQRDLGWHHRTVVILPHVWCACGCFGYRGYQTFCTSQMEESSW